MDSFPKIKSSQLVSPLPPPYPSNSDSSSFPIIAIAIIAILATAFLLLTYNVLLINCCLNCHRSLPPPNSPATEIRGLHESIIRSIPLLQYKNNSMATEQSSSECAVCLSEFQEDETVRVIPICSHLFHVDCIDIWLQNSPNCPLCRTTISSSALLHRFPLSSPENPISGGEERGFVVIEMGVIGSYPSRQFSQERQDSGELPAAAVGKLEQGKERRKLQKGTSFGDEWIDTREKDEGFCVQPIRRSISMDSSLERGMYLAVQAAVQQSHRGSPGGDGRGKRFLFSFGSGRSYRNGVHVHPLRLEQS